MPSPLGGARIGHMGRQHADAPEERVDVFSGASGPGWQHDPSSDFAQDIVGFQPTRLERIHCSDARTNNQDNDGGVAPLIAASFRCAASQESGFEKI